MTHTSYLRRASAFHRRPRGGASGFTLTEILIAIALIVTVVAIAVTNLSGILNSGQSDIAKTFVTSELTTPLMMYKMHTGNYPTTDQGIHALINAPDNVAGWRGPYLSTSNVPLDPWGKQYYYAFPGPHNGSAKPDIWSLGPDGIDNTGDEVNNWSN